MNPSLTKPQIPNTTQSTPTTSGFYNQHLLNSACCFVSPIDLSSMDGAREAKCLDNIYKGQEYWHSSSCELVCKEKAMLIHRSEVISKTLRGLGSWRRVIIFSPSSNSECGVHSTTVFNCRGASTDI